ncbi:unnamed protein product [Paramecium pentaurelia]|uniref:Uncharacterized protein n=1 Tax=Paramecium pentaurelia TaxID=43138 RepID=A0A8S1TRC7_9CILI|nr:unnamed protein product [Paramecium pentaurelia]
MNQLEKTPNQRLQRTQSQQDEKWFKQLHRISSSLKNLKTTQERNVYIKKVARQRELDKIIHEKQVIQQKSYLLDRSKKKFLSLIRCKDPETFFLKFKPIQKPLNMLRMVSELNLAEKVQMNLNQKSKHEDESSPIVNRTFNKNNKMGGTKVTELNVSKESSQGDIMKPRKTLEYLFQDNKKQNPLLQNEYDLEKSKSKKQSQSRSYSQYSKSNMNTLLKTDINTLLTEMDQVNTKMNNKLLKISKVSSQILARNGIFLQTKNIPNSIKVNSQDNICLEDDNSSLASHTELMLDNLYGNTKKLNSDTKNLEMRKKEYEQESIKLFYKKIYCKI